MKIFDMNNLWVIRMIDENFSFFVIGFDKTEAIEKTSFNGTANELLERI